MSYGILKICSLNLFGDLKEQEKNETNRWQPSFELTLPQELIQLMICVFLGHWTRFIDH